MTLKLGVLLWECRYLFVRLIWDRIGNDANFMILRFLSLSELIEPNGPKVTRVLGSV